MAVICAQYWLTSEVMLLLLSMVCLCLAAPASPETETVAVGVGDSTFDSPASRSPWTGSKLRSDDPAWAAPSGERLAYTTTTDRVLRQSLAAVEAGRTYTLTAWARAVNPRGKNLRKTVASVSLGSGSASSDSLAATVSAEVSPKVIRDPAGKAIVGDDGWNTWLEGDYRMAHYGGISFQRLDQDPISDPWTAVADIDRLCHDACDAMAPAVVDSGPVRGNYGTFYDDGDEPYSRIDLIGMTGNAPSHGWLEATGEDAAGPLWEPVITHDGDESPWVIDAHVYVDTGRMWMTWGGYQVWVTELDPATGMIKGLPGGPGYDREFTSHPAGVHHRVASWSRWKGTANYPSGFEAPENWGGDDLSPSGYMEGPCLFKKDRWWYVCGSYGDMGASYTIRCCRSSRDEPTGDFYDKMGRDCSRFYDDADGGRYGQSVLLADDGNQLVPGHPHFWEEQDGTAIYMGYDYRPYRAGEGTSGDDGVPLTTDDLGGVRRVYFVDGWPTIWTPLEVTWTPSKDDIGKPLTIELALDASNSHSSARAGFDLVSVSSKPTEPTVAPTSPPTKRTRKPTPYPTSNFPTPYPTSLFPTKYIRTPSSFPSPYVTTPYPTTAYPTSYPTTAFPTKYPTSPPGQSYDSFPVKSFNLEFATPITFYEVIPAVDLEDPHPVHGIQTEDGGYVIVGKAMEESEKFMEAFAIKLDAKGKLQWGWRSGAANGDDAANSVVQLPGSDDLLVAGFRTVDGVYKRSLSLLSVETGAAKWTSTAFGDSPNLHGAWETIDLTDGKDAILLGGVHRKPSTAEFFFKSYGNVFDGVPVVMRIPIASLAGSHAPVDAASATWTSSEFGDDEEFVTVKAVRPMPGGGEVVALLFGESCEGCEAALAVLDAATGAVKSGWPRKYGTAHGEGTDVAVARDGTGFAIAGHGSGGAPGTLSGRLTKVELDGARTWSKSYSVGGNTRMIFNECWGISALEDGGFALSCGTGVEDCSAMTGSMKRKCQKGSPVPGVDTRPGAVPMPPGVWQSLVIRTDAMGNLEWQRVDVWRDPEDPELGSSGWEAHSSASEHVILARDGSLVFVQDEGTGVGIMKLGVEERV